MNNKISVFKLKLLTGISFILILMPILLYALWIYSFNSQSNQADRVKMYQSYFPDFLKGRYTISLISLVLCLLGIILSTVTGSRTTSLLKAINIIVLIAGILVGGLYLFSLMWLEAGFFINTMVDRMETFLKTCQQFYELFRINWISRHRISNDHHPEEEWWMNIDLKSQLPSPGLLNVFFINLSYIIYILYLSFGFDRGLISRGTTHPLYRH